MNTQIKNDKKLRKTVKKRLTKSVSPVSSSSISSSLSMSLEEIAGPISSQFSTNQSISSYNENQNVSIKRYECKIVPKLEIKLDCKVELICSLASLLNIKNLEQNSRILLDLSQSKENCDLLIKSKNNLLITKIIYDEWHELFEYCHTAKQQQQQNFLSFFIYENRKNLSDLLNRRLNARRLGEQALNNLILNEYESNRNNGFKIDLLELVFKIVKFNENLFEQFITQIKQNNPIKKQYFNDEKFNLINFFLNDLNKKALVDIKNKLGLVELGTAQCLCELIELIWIFDETELITNEKIQEITVTCLKIINILINVKNHNTIIQNLINQLCSRRQWLTTLYRCLRKQLSLKINYDLIKTISNLIKNLTCHLNENLNIQSSRVDENSLAFIAFNEIKFASLLTQYAVTFASKIEPDTLKQILSSLLNLSILTFDNKKSICNVNGSLELFTHFLKSDNRSRNRQIEEISISLLRTLSAYYSLDEKLRQKLRNLNFYEILLSHSLTSSNLNIVANACNILWTMSSRSKSDQLLLIDLGAETSLKALSYSSFDFISISCLATLKNISSDVSSTTSSLSLSKSSSNSSDKSLNLSDSIMTSSSASSSFSFQSYPILANRSRKQMIEKTNEFQQKLNSFDFNNNIASSESSTSLSLTSDCSSPSLSRSSSNDSMSTTSSSSSSSSATYSKPRIKKNSYYLNENSIPNIVLNKKDDEPKKIKRVTFSGKEILLFEVNSSSSNESLSNPCDNCNIEIVDEKFENINCKNEIKHPFSPPINLKYIKSNSLLLNKSLFYSDDYNLEENGDDKKNASNCLIATCDSCLNENKENNSNLILTSNQKLESNASLSLLLEPAKDLIIKMDASLNTTNNVNFKNEYNPVKMNQNKATNIQNPPLPSRSTSLQNKNYNKLVENGSKIDYLK